MKFHNKGILWIMALSLIALGTACNNSGNIPAASTMATEMDSISYAIGLNIGTNLDQLEDNELDPYMIFRGVLDVMEEGDGQALTDEEVQTLMAAFEQRMTANAEAKMAQEGAANIEAGIAFLEENEGKEGVVVTSSGLQYLVMKEGSGPSPTAEDVVKVHYHGTLLDGTVFDSSVDRGEPIEFPLNRVIPGWTEGVQLMNVGSKYRFFIPSDLAYGPQGSPPAIPPSSTLIFEVELLEINPES